ncbi:MAG: B12-binding domain-containing radical SAM protein [Deltaproteobacteria bacterium]|nr:B12-binding domain-containing radical SAM protein [Deltaproteobacteria bacterium]
MKIDIIVVYEPRYMKGHARDFVPPVTGMYLAALTPNEHHVRLFHQQVDEIDRNSEADLIALSFFSGFAEEGYRLADFFRSRGKLVIAGGPHVTFCAEEALCHVDAVVMGEAESVWETLLNDAQRGKLSRKYVGEEIPLTGMPMPRYDLLSSRYFIPRVIQATRGCPYSCSFCTVPVLYSGLRVRPVDEVIREIQYNDFPHWWQRRIVWFWDDNLLVKRQWAKELLTRMIPLKKWWLTQASIDIVNDPELLQLMKASGCIGIFLGIESFNPDSIEESNKKNNHVDTYKESVRVLHRYGIAVMGGMIAGFDNDTPEGILAMENCMAQIGVDVPFLSILTPFMGTPLYARLERENRLNRDRGWRFYNGYNAAFSPKKMTADQLTDAHRNLWKKVFSPAAVLRRIGRAIFQSHPGALLLSFMMNGFYGHKALTGNLPVDFSRKPDEVTDNVTMHRIPDMCP